MIDMVLLRTSFILDDPVSTTDPSYFDRKDDQPPRIRCGVIVRTSIFASCLDLGGRTGRRAVSFGLSRDDPFIDQ